MELSWTRPASNDRRAIRDYIAADNPRAALAFDELLSRKAQQLLDYPALGRLGRVSGTRELITHQNYVIVYSVTGELIRILRVLHVARRWPG